LEAEGGIKRQKDPKAQIKALEVQKRALEVQKRALKARKRALRTL
jgi:hypothetical protein